MLSCLHGFSPFLIGFRLLSMACSSSQLKLTNYDLVGFDLDNTLCRYDLPKLFKSHFDFMAKYLKETKNYSSFNDAFDEAAIDFISRGILLDFDKGNLLKLDRSGGIVRASHGTRLLSLQSIENQYGTNRRWNISDGFIKDKGSWLGETSATTRSMMDFTDVAATVIYARAVDSNAKSHRAWPDVLSAIIAMYSDDSDWSQEFRRNFTSYAYKTDERVLKWLRELKKRTKLALITSSGVDGARVIAEHALGPQWKDLFDVIVYKAGKPWFFTDPDRSFKDVKGSPTEFRLHGEYTEGSSATLMKTLNSSRLLYVGDSFMHDMIAPNIDVIAVVEEAKAEGFFPGSCPERRKYLTSKFWGSLFYEENERTLFGDIVFNTKLCISDVDYMAERSIDEEFQPFWKKT